MAPFLGPARENNPIEKEAEVDVSSNYVSGRRTKASFGMEDNFPPEYEPEIGPEAQSTSAAYSTSK